MIKDIIANMKTVEKTKNFLPSGINADEFSNEDLENYAYSILEGINKKNINEKIKDSWQKEINSIKDILKTRNPKHLEDEEKQSTEFTDEDIQRFGKSALNIK